MDDSSELKHLIFWNEENRLVNIFSIHVLLTQPVVLGLRHGDTRDLCRNPAGWEHSFLYNYNQ
jgi:hypothetical protein